MKISDSHKWQAVVARDKGFDGKFVFCVKTTKIYCRPSCAARRPNRDNVEFFHSSDVAEQNGYRACKRCRPDQEQSNTIIMVEKMTEYIRDHIDRNITLEELGETFNGSPTHLQRIFKAATGLSPKQFAAEVRRQTLKNHLRAGTRITDAIFDSGYSSSSRFYEKATTQLGMTPRQFAKHGAGLTIRYWYYVSPLGLMLIAATDAGICFLQFGETESSLREQLEAEFSKAKLEPLRKPNTETNEALDRFFTKGIDVALPLHNAGTSFQQCVWRYLQTIPVGETRTYTEVAAAIGKPNAVRAVASACASNAVALAIPCHRVVRQNGDLAGYRWGIDRKKQLLKSEQTNTVSNSKEKLRNS